MADETEYGLVMPFVVCTSNGGPLDDKAFVAGATYGQHDAELRSAPLMQSWAAYIIPEMVPQYDLLAMHYGFVMTVEPWEDYPEDWVLVTFTRKQAEEEELEP